MFVDGTIQILPLALHPNRRFVHAPADVHGSFASMKRFFQQGVLFDDPSMHGGVIQLHPAFFHECFDVWRVLRGYARDHRTTMSMTS